MQKVGVISRRTKVLATTICFGFTSTRRLGSANTSSMAVVKAIQTISSTWRNVRQFALEVSTFIPAVLEKVCNSEKVESSSTTLAPATNENHLLESTIGLTNSPDISEMYWLYFICQH